MKENPFNHLLSFLQSLEQQQISYTLAHHRDEAVMVTASLPGQRWEIEFLDDGSIEVEKFVSNGEIHGADALQDLLERDDERLNGSLITRSFAEMTYSELYRYVLDHREDNEAFYALMDRVHEKGMIVVESEEHFRELIQAKERKNKQAE